MLKQSIGIGMLFIAGHAYSSNIIVTTTADTKADDQQCSLREAIEYINLGMPEEGYLGCGGKNASSVILLALYTTNFTEPLSYQGSAFLKLPKFP